MRKRFYKIWLSITIKEKIVSYTGVMLLIIILSVLLNLWMVRFSLLDFNNILQDNVKCSNLSGCLENERALFRAYIKNGQEDTKARMLLAIEETRKAVEAMPFDYTKIGEERYARTWSIRNCYEVYRERRDTMLELPEGETGYIRRLYEVYDMQDYLQGYAKMLMSETLVSGSAVYQKMVPWLVRVPIIVGVIGYLLLFVMVRMSRLTYQAIVDPIMKLVRISKKIAANDFFVEDVTVDNEDEMGELVHAFNKMKYATGEYIMALEEKRKTLDLLHEEERAMLETEKRLESMNLELLKSQIQPHFLFNTLNVIGGMATLEDAVTTEKMIQALSSLFRYNLKTPEAEVILARELKVVEDYLYLQQMRFGSRVLYVIDNQVNDQKVWVPTYTFQPLVENAIIHGLSPKEEGGKIRIRIWQRQDLLHITVADSGVGMTPEQREELQRRLEDRSDARSGIGISNVYRRIYAMYENGSMHIYSRKDVGTVAVLKIPQKEKRQQE